MDNKDSKLEPGMFATVQWPISRQFDPLYPESGDTDLFGRAPESFTDAAALPGFGSTSIFNSSDDFVFGQ